MARLVAWGEGEVDAGVALLLGLEEADDDLDDFAGFLTGADKLAAVLDGAGELVYEGDDIGAAVGGQGWPVDGAVFA